MKKLLVFALCCLAIVAAFCFVPAKTVESAQAAEQDSAQRVLQTASSYRDDLRTMLDPASAPKDADAARQDFLSATKDLEHLAGVWKEDIENLETLANQKFGEWKNVIDTIETVAARLPELENYTNNLHSFNHNLSASKTALEQLRETLAKGADVTRCIKSREYNNETKLLVENLQTLITSAQGRGESYLKACDHLLELLQERQSVQSASAN